MLCVELVRKSLGMKHRSNSTCKTATYVVALMIGFSCLANGQVKDLAGWQDTRWGMNQKELLAVKGLSLQKLAERNDYQTAGVRYGYADYGSELLIEGITPLQAQFVMDLKTDKLTEVYITPHDWRESSQAIKDLYFERLDALLTDKYGSPKYSNDSTTGRYPSRTRRWSFPTTIIELKFTGGTISHLSLDYISAERSEKKKL
jgi:hypothetical protein